MKKKNLFRKCALIVLAFAAGFFAIGKYFESDVAVYTRGSALQATATSSTEKVEFDSTPAPYVPTHQARPEVVKAIYISSWVAGTPSMFNRLVALVERTELNAVIIDIKDDTGYISYKVKDPELAKEETDSKRIPDIEILIKDLHEKGIYVMGRVSTFQDPLYVKKHPELAVIRKSDGKVWRDRKGLSWLDAGATKTWEYLARVARESFARGFDEINFDYIRFPTDGNMSDIGYRFYDAKTMTKPEQMKLFYAYLHEQLSATQDCPLRAPEDSLVCSTYIPHSADLFGMTTTAEDDMGIGQIFVDALPYFDYIAPMVYPSHYGPGINGYKKPAEHPYEMVAYAMNGAIERASSTAKSTPPQPLHQGEGNSTLNTQGSLLRAPEDCPVCSYKQKIVPWLQDFDLGATYTAAMVRAQIKAVNDAGLKSWILWDPANRYTEGAFLTE